MKITECVICGNKLVPTQRICCSIECAKERQRQISRKYYATHPSVREHKREWHKKRRMYLRGGKKYGFNLRNPLNLSECLTTNDKQRYFILKYGG